MNNIIEKNNVKTKYGMEELAKDILKCQILDDRITRFNCSGLNFEELLYQELLTLKKNFGTEFIRVFEYDFYFNEINPNEIMTYITDNALAYMQDVIDEARNERKKYKYDTIIDMILERENDFYNNELKGMLKVEKRYFIRETIIYDLADFMYKILFQYFSYNGDEANRKEYWKIVLELAEIISLNGKQKEIEKNEELEDKIMNKFFLNYDKTVEILKEKI